jgi:hypothetical protein
VLTLGGLGATFGRQGPLLPCWAGRVGWRILGLLGLVGVAVLLLLSVARPALAAGPQEQIQKVLDAVAAVLKDPSRQGPDKQADLEKVGLSRQLP